MSEEYLNLYKLELGDNPYSAKFVTTPPEEVPSECVLPEEISFTSLPTLDTSLPELACNHLIDTPLIPTPYFCTPELTGGISIGICEGSRFDVSLDGSAGIVRQPDSDCNYNLEGDFEFCFNICKLKTISIADFTVTNKIENQETPEFTLNADCISSYPTGDPDNPQCCTEYQFSGNLSMSACSEVKIELDDGYEDEFDITIYANGDDVGTIKLDLGFKIEDDEDNPCSKKIKFSPSVKEANLEFNTTELNICDNGVSRTITIFTVNDEDEGGM